jgi:hypothetical protein
MQVWFDSPSNPYIIDVHGENETLGTFDITDEVNSENANTVFVKIHNTKGQLIATKAGNYFGGRICTKLVVTVW